MLKIIAHKSILLIFLAVLFLAPSAHGAALGVAPNNDSLTKGLVGYWTMDGKNTTKTTTADISGNGNTGTLTNGVVPTAGRIGQGLNFDGVNDYVDIGTFTTFSKTTPFSVSAWIKTSGASGQKGIVSDWDVSTSPGWQFVTQVTTGNLSFALVNSSGTAGYIKNGTRVTSGSWHHVVATYLGTNNAAGITLYGNGVPMVDSIILNTDPGTLVGGQFQIGRRNHATNTINFPGSIDDVRIYNRAITPAEIKRLYNAGTSKFQVAPNNDSLSKGLVGYWPFDGKQTSKTTTGDISGNGNTGTLTNGVKPVAGRIGQGLVFDGVNDFVSLGTPAILTGITKGTLSAWVKTSGAGSSFRAIVADPDRYNMFFGGAGCSDNTLTFYDWSAATTRCSTSGNLANNTWHHVVAVFQSGVTNGSTFYVDGKAAGIFTMTVSAQNANVTIGQNTNVQFFNGSIDDVRIYNRVLSAAEVKRLYTSTAGSFINVAPNNNSLSKGLVGYWPFDGKQTSKTTTLDISGNGNTGTLTGRPYPTAGRIGQGLNFDGVDDYTINSSGGSFINTALSVSVWAKSPNTTSSAFVSVWRNTIGWILWLHSGSLKWGDNNSSLVVWTGGEAAFEDNAWHHIVGIRDGNTMRLYFDGIQRASAANGTLGTPTSPRLCIGAYGTLSNNACEVGFHAGTLDDVRVYNRALSAAEVKRLYNGGR